MTTSSHRDHEAGGIVVGIDIGGTKTALMVWDRHAETVLAEEAVPTPTEIGPHEFVDGLAEEIAALVARAGHDVSALLGIGIAVPGLVDAAEGTVLLAGNLAGWVDIPLRAWLGEHFPPTVAIAVEHDANAAALGEQWRGAARGERDFVFVALGTGIGAGVMLNGQLYRGAHHAAGEVGNFVVGREFLGEERHGQGNLARLIGGRTLRERAEAATGEEMSAADAIASDDDELEPIASDVIDYLAMTVIAIASLLDPPLIVIGGGTAEAGDDLFAPVRDRVAPELAQPTRIVHAELGPEAQLYGAIFSAIVCAEEGAGCAASAL